MEETHIGILNEDMKMVGENMKKGAFFNAYNAHRILDQYKYMSPREKKQESESRGSREILCFFCANLNH